MFRVEIRIPDVCYENGTPEIVDFLGKEGEGLKCRVDLAGDRRIIKSFDDFIPEGLKEYVPKLNKFDLDRHVLTVSVNSVGSGSLESKRAHDLVHHIEAAPFLKKIGYYSEYEAVRMAEVDCYVKWFTPDSGWTWYVTEWDGKDECFGLVHGFEWEWGYFSLDEILSLKGPMRLKVERDLWFGPKRMRNIAPHLYKSLPQPIEEKAEFMSELSEI